MNSLEDTLYYTFHLSGNNSYVSDSPHFDVNNEVKLGLRGYSLKHMENCEVPVYLGNKFLSNIATDFNNHKTYSEYICPLFIKNYNWEYRSTFTAHKLLTICMDNASDVLWKFELNNTIYYGNKGILLDSNFNVIILLTVSFYKDNLNKATIYLSPNIYSKQSDIMNKTIIKSLLPLWVNHTFGVSAFRGSNNISPTIIIENVDRFIQRSNAIVDNSSYVDNKEIQQNIIKYLIKESK